MIFYARLTVSSSVEMLYKAFRDCGAEEDQIILDKDISPKKEGSTFQKMKKKLELKKNILVLDSIYSLGKNNREIYKELKWIKENDIKCLILDLPETINNTDTSINLLVEVFSLFAKKEIANVKKKQKEGIERAINGSGQWGRQRIPYPKNWHEVYDLWERKEITIPQFMKLTGLKRGTLYNLIKEYQLRKNELVSDYKRIDA